MVTIFLVGAYVLARSREGPSGILPARAWPLPPTVPLGKDPFMAQDDDGPFSVRLAQILLVYADPTNKSGLGDLRLAVRRGRFPWLEAELGTCLREGLLTSESWAQVTGLHDRAGCPDPHRLRQLWHTVFPALPHPQD